MFWLSFAVVLIKILLLVNNPWSVEGSNLIFGGIKSIEIIKSIEFAQPEYSCPSNNLRRHCHVSPKLKLFESRVVENKLPLG